MSKGYVFLADGFEEIEGLTVVDLLRRAEIDIATVSITGKRTVMGAHGIEVIADMILEDGSYEDGQLLVLPGGMPGTLNLLENDQLMKIIENANRLGIMIGAICAAPRILGLRGLLKEKTATCYPGNEIYLEGARATGKDVEESDHIITSKGLGTAIDFSLALIRRLKSDAVALQIANSIQYRHYQP